MFQSHDALVAPPGWSLAICQKELVLFEIKDPLPVRPPTEELFSWECRPRRDLPVRGRLAGRHDITVGTEYIFTSFYLFQHLALQHQGFEQLGDDIHFSSPGRFLEEYGSNGAHYAGIMQTSFGHCPIAVHTMQLANRWCLRQICTAIMYLSSAAWLVCRPVAVQSSHLNNQ